MSVTTKQRDIAELLKIQLTPKESYRGAAAKIRDFVSEATDDYPPSDPTEEQVEFAQDLEIELQDETRRTLSAKISDELEKRNIAALKELNLTPGDSVCYLPSGELQVISTIKENGKIYFKGKRPTNTPRFQRIRHPH